MTQEPDQYYTATLVNSLPTVTFPPKPYHRRITNLVVGNSVASAVTVYRGQLSSVPVAQNLQGRNNTLSGSITLPAGQVLFVQWDTVGANVSDAFARASFARDDSPLGDSSTVDSQQWSSSTVTQLIVGDAVNGEVIITQGITAALQAFYAPVGSISAVSLRLMPADGSYFYIVAGYNVGSGNDFVAMGNAKPNAVLATDIAQQWFSFYNGSSGISQINLGDTNHDQRLLIDANFSHFGNGLRGDVSMDGVTKMSLALALGQHAWEVWASGSVGQNFPTIYATTDSSLWFGPGTAAADCVIDRVSPSVLSISDSVANLSGVAETWHNAALQNLFTNRGAGFPLLSYRRVASPAACVQIIGEITSGTTVVSNTTLTNVPVGYRPTTEQGFPVINDSGNTFLWVSALPNGDVALHGTWANGNNVRINGMISLDL